MTEIPEHLLQRSREARARLGGGDGGSTESASSDTGAASSAPAATPAAAAPSMPAHPEPAEVAPPPPPSPVVEAYNRRRKIPFWAMPVLAALPLWAYIFAGTLEPPPGGPGPEELGAELYAAQGCAGCHGAAGGGGVGPAFSGGAIYETWPTFEGHFEWIRLGSAGWLAEHGDTYGANATAVAGGMPGFDTEKLSDAELLYVVLYERLVLGGANPDAIDAERLEAAAELLFEHPERSLEEILEELGGAEG